VCFFDCVEPLDASCLSSSLPSNDTLKRNVPSIESGSLDFFTINITSNEPECVKVPFVALYNRAPTKNKES